MSTRILLDSGPSGPLTLHRVQDWLRCRRFFALSRRYPPFPSGMPGRAPLVRGSFVHVGLAHVFARKMAVQRGADPEMYYPPLEAIELARVAMRAEFGNFVDTEVDLARRVVTAYEREHRHEERYEVLYVEQVFTISVTSPVTGRVWQYQQRPDLIVRDRYTRKVQVHDHKTHRGNDFDAAMEGYAPAVQFLSYSWWGSQFFDEAWGGTWIHMLSTSDVGRAEVRPIVPAPNLVRLFPLIYTQSEEEMAAAAVSRLGLDAYTPAANEQVCYTRYGKCDFWDVCLWGKPGTAIREELVQVRVTADSGAFPRGD